MFWRFLSSIIAANQVSKMDVETDAMPSAPRPKGEASLDEEIGIPSATPRDKIEQNTESRNNRSPRIKHNASREGNFYQSYEKPKPKKSTNPKSPNNSNPKPPNNTMYQYIISGSTNVHIGHNFGYMGQKSHAHDNKNDMPEFVKKLTMLKRCAQRSDLHTVALHITPDGFKTLAELLSITNEAKRICEDYKKEGFYEVVFKVLEHWAQTNVSQNTGPMVNILCRYLWHIGVREEGGADALKRIAQNEFKESKYE